MSRAAVTNNDLPAIELKGMPFTLTLLDLESESVQRIEAGLDAKIAQLPGFFDALPIVLDCTNLSWVDADPDEATEHDESASQAAREADERLANLNAIVAMIRAKGLHVVALTGAAPGVAAALSLPEVHKPKPRAANKPSVRTAQSETKESEPPPQEGKASDIESRQKQAVPGGVSSQPDAVSSQPGGGAAATTGPMIVDRPARSGQQIYARGTDLVLTAGVNADAEVIADGNVHVYGTLRGRVIAGASGNEQARIFATAFDPQLVSVAGAYKVFDEPDSVLRGRPVQVFLDGEQLVVRAI